MANPNMIGGGGSQVNSKKQGMSLLFVLCAWFGMIL